MNLLQQFATHPLFIESLLVVSGLGFLLFTSSYVVNSALNYAEAKDGGNGRSSKEGFVIGKSENILVFVLVFSGELTALALIFAAQNITTRESDNDLFPSYVLVGTIVNFTYSLVISY